MCGVKTLLSVTLSCVDGVVVRDPGGFSGVKIFSRRLSTLCRCGLLTSNAGGDGCVGVLEAVHVGVLEAAHVGILEAVHVGILEAAHVGILEAAHVGILEAARDDSLTGDHGSRTLLVLAVASTLLLVLGGLVAVCLVWSFEACAQHLVYLLLVWVVSKGTTESESTSKADKQLFPYPCLLLLPYKQIQNHSMT